MECSVARDVKDFSKELLEKTCRMLVVKTEIVQLTRDIGTGVSFVGTKNV